MGVSVILACAGKGERAGFNKNKLLVKNGGITAIERVYSAFFSVKEINQIMIPGVSELGVQEGLVDYCNLRGRVFPIIDAPINATYEEVLDFFSAFQGE